MDKTSFLQAFPGFSTEGRSEASEGEIQFHGSGSFFLLGREDGPARVLCFLVDAQQDDETVFSVSVWVHASRFVFHFGVGRDAEPVIASLKCGRVEQLRSVTNPTDAVDIVFSTNPPSYLRLWSTASSSKQESARYLGSLNCALEAALGVKKEPRNGSGQGGPASWRSAWLAAVKMTANEPDWWFGGAPDETHRQLTAQQFAAAAARISENGPAPPCSAESQELVHGSHARVVAPDELADMVTAAEREASRRRNAFLEEVYGSAEHDVLVREDPQ